MSSPNNKVLGYLPYFVCPSMVSFNCGARSRHDMVVEVSMCKYHDTMVLPTSAKAADLLAASLSNLKQSQPKQQLHVHSFKLSDLHS